MMMAGSNVPASGCGIGPKISYEFASEEGSVNLAEYDIILKGGTIVDGTRTPRYVSDVAIKDGIVAKIGGLRGSGASQVLDASGLIVAPGFVDLHTHYDAQIQWDPYCTVSGWHGITTVLIGNCGFGFAPCRPEDQERAMLMMTRNEAIPYGAMKEGMLWDWETYPEFLDSLDRMPKGINLFTYVPLTPLYVWVMGLEAARSRRPTEVELSKMCQLVGEGMDAGASGWSAQVLGEGSDQRDFDGVPMITDLMTHEELLTFARLLRERDEGYIQLTYLEAGPDGRFDRDATWKFFETVAEVSTRPVIYISVTARINSPEEHRGALAWLEDCSKRGLRVYGQAFTLQDAASEFTFREWNLFDNSPSWREATIGTPAERKKKMQDPDLRAKMRAEWDAGIRPGQTGVIGASSLEGLVVAEVATREFERYQGRKVGDIAQEQGKHVVDALLDMVVTDDLQTEFIAMPDVGNPNYTAEVMNSPYTVPGISDGGAHVKFSTGGRFPTEALIWLVRDEGVVTLEEAHYKLSYLPAFFGGARDRGYIREGAAADIVAYDLDGLKLLPTEVVHDLPGNEWRRVQRAEGYRWTIVNGQVTFEDGKPTGALPGKFLRHGMG